MVAKDFDTVSPGIPSSSKPGLVQLGLTLSTPLAPDPPSLEPSHASPNPCPSFQSHSQDPYIWSASDQTVDGSNRQRTYVPVVVDWAGEIGVAY